MTILKCWILAKSETVKDVDVHNYGSKFGAAREKSRHTAAIGDGPAGKNKIIEKN